MFLLLDLTSNNGESLGAYVTFVSRRITTLPARIGRAICTLGSGQQHRAEPVVIVAVAIVVVRAEQPSVGTTDRATATLEPTTARADEAGVIAAPGLVVARDRHGMESNTTSTDTDIIIGLARVNIQILIHAMILPLWIC